ncbi:hypothetical protein [Streptomyces sp. NPDC005283]|uniref:hypothetical protein n=1 Tax=Streptomyces sp. NPDC005283 TaxID=3156871 RepID=UPI0034553FFA
MVDILKQVVICALITGALWVATTVLLHLIAYGHVVGIRLAFRVRRALVRMPAGAIFHSREGCLILTAYNPAEDKEKSLPLAVVGRPSLLRWGSGAAKSKAALRRRATGEMVWRAALFALVTVPVFAAAVWLTFTASLLWAYVVLFLIAHQILLFVIGRVFIMKYWSVAWVIGYLFLHRVQLWHPSPPVAAAVYFGLTLVSMAVLAWAVKDEKPSLAA